MTFIQLFAFVILPLLIAAAGWGLVLFNERRHGVGDGSGTRKGI